MDNDKLIEAARGISKVADALKTTGASVENMNKALDVFSRSVTIASTEKPKQNWLWKFLHRIIDLFKKI